MIAPSGATPHGMRSTFLVQESTTGYVHRMDILSDLFREAGLRRRLLNHHHLTSGRALRFACDRSVGFHVAVAGTTYIHPSGAPSPIALQPGDIALSGRGCDHLLSPSESLRGLPVDDIGFATARTPATAHGDVSTIGGAYQLWNTPVHPFFTELPDWFVLRAADSPRFGAVSLTISMLTEEAARESLGRDTVLHGLLDVLFTHLLRAVIEVTGATCGSWSQAMREPRIRDAVALLHDEHAQQWTLQSLASAVGMSRSALAENFRRTMGDTPLSYLRTVRIQRAMRLLTESSLTLEQVALAVGYGDAFGFSKAFKKAVGESPGEFRRRDAAEHALPWRLPPTDAVGAG